VCFGGPLSHLPPSRTRFLVSNCDIKNLSRGSRLWLPVFVDGANLSMGDMHFSQGDGEGGFHRLRGSQAAGRLRG
jgi:acetamidase/formamidase